MEKSNGSSKYLSDILRYDPRTKKEAERSLRKILGKDLVEIIDQHNTPALLAVYGSSEAPRILKVEVGRPLQKTAREIHWYRALDRFSKRYCAPFFFGGLYSNHIAVYELEFLGKYNLLEDLIVNNMIAEKQIQGYVWSSFDLLFDFFALKQTRLVSFEESETLYWLKIKRRMEEASRVPWLKELLQQKTIIINDEELPGIPFIIERISMKSLREKVTPRQWGFAHGDLHFGNMLVKDEGMRVIDPNGKLELPIEYDIGKLLHSMHGHYNYIHRGKFSLKSKYFLQEYTFKIDAIKQEGSSVESFFLQRFSEEVILRSLFSECCHFLTMLPHHVNDQKETVALYLQTVKLFQNFLEKIKD